MAAESVLVGSSGGSAAALGSLPDASGTANEVLSYVESLVELGRIALDEKAETGKLPLYKTHRVQRVKGRKILSRLRFACY